MPHKIAYNSQEKYIEMKVWGSLLMDEAKDIISEMIQVSKQNNCLLILGDYREATMDLSVVEIYKLPTKISEAAAASKISEFKIKRALVADKNSENFYFFETVTLNRGQSIKLFSDMDEAKEWLFKD
ncbi:MAG: hypothetical protein U0Z26_17180 [Anaerolineales bacterium]